ncbi:DUF2298 domain-containing protein [Halosegnis longus]|uniref:DUF2298 domain-containing protein n=1 Tax=Halosegnis longus TaxID=2216012 RepID=UPI00096ABFAB|nr:DUF2298 domain-containing protein [Salella cibi]
MEYGLVLAWGVAYLVLGAIALPLAARLFGSTARGAGFALPLVFAALGLGGFLLGTVPGLFGVPVAVVVVAGLAAASYYFGAEVDIRDAAAPGVVFLLGFAFVVLLRAFDPGVAPLGGEKFLDFGLLRSLLRTDTLPPEDMWFANEPIQYYYGGHVIAALLTELLSTAPRYAYNLALAGFYATAVSTVYGFAAMVADDAGYSPVAAGALSAFFLGIASNLYTATQFVGWLLPDGLARTLAGALGLGSQAVSEFVAWSPADFYYWSASRLIDGAITEFPLFAYLNGDLHAHMMDVPLLLLVAGLLYAYWRTPAEELRRRRLLALGLVPPIAGYIGVVNTWSLPTAALGLPFLVYALAPAAPRSLLTGAVPEQPAETDARLRAEGVRFGAALLLAGVTTLLALAWTAPFWLGSASSRPIGFLPDRTGVGELLLVHGGFLAAFVAYYLARGRDLDGRLGQVAVAGALVLAGVGLVVGAPALALVAPLVLGGWLLLRTESAGYETLLVVAGAGIVVLIEFVYIAEPQSPDSRLNTVFKLYAQVWALWAPAAGLVLVRLAGLVRERASVPTPGRRTAVAGRVLLVVLVATTGLYGALAVPSHIDAASPTANERGPTLDATAFVEIRHAGEAPAIEYISQLEGQPTIVTAAPAGYRWNPSDGNGASAPASLTGVPTVAGWYHERQYRSPEAYEQRVTDVLELYTGEPATQRRLIEQYDVRYIYVGPTERTKYGDITVGALDSVEPIERGDVTIYRVTSGE